MLKVESRVDNSQGAGVRGVHQQEGNDLSSCGAGFELHIRGGAYPEYGQENPIGPPAVQGIHVCSNKDSKEEKNFLMRD